MSGLKGAATRPQGVLFYNYLTRFPIEAQPNKSLIPPMISDGRLSSQAQLDAALALLKKRGVAPLTVDEVEAACGVGIVVSQDRIREVVAAVIAAHRDRVIEERYRTLGVLLKEVKAVEPWADGKLAKDSLEAALLALLGPETEEDKKPLPKKKPAAAAAAGAASSPADGKGKGKGAAEAGAAAEEKDPLAKEQAVIARFPMPEENTTNDPALLAAHLKRTGGKVVTRFPPEPNGFLHIGHAKAMNLSFTFAKNYGGECILRFDDTNPDGESQEFVDSIMENVKWLGHTPSRITYASDYMEQLYEIAVDLIKRRLAFACHQTKAEIAASRETLTDSPWRDRPVEESIKVFADMRKGKYPEGGAVLRLRMDMKNDNPNFRDPAAWRIKYTPHPHVGDAWCIYPTYDYTHAINDSLEDITHSLCTLEFQTRHDSYMWLLDAAKLYKPHVYEFSRLNISNTVMSKRKLKQLVLEGHVRGWDDPRMPTIMGLRRRGYSANAINAFVKEIGVTKNFHLLDMNVLEHHARVEMNEVCPRAFAVVDPLRVEVTNWPAGKVEVFEVEGGRKLPFSGACYIEQSDFRAVDSKDYYGLAPGKEAILRYAFHVRCDEFVADPADPARNRLIRCTYLPNATTKPKGVLHWVGEPSAGVAPAAAEFRLYSRLLSCFDPNDLEGAANWLDCVNKDAEVVKHGYVEPGLAQAKPSDRFQFERVGFFVADSKDHRPGSHPVYNRTVTLREDKAVKEVKNAALKK
jgi:glutaminyl-tRNA synthetase